LHVLVAGLVVSNVSFLLGLILFFRLTELEFQDIGTASRAVLYISIFPTAFYFTAIYTESTFFVLAVGSLYFARRQMWVWAVILGILCSLTRIIGILMWGVVALEWMRLHGWTLATVYRRQAWLNLWQGFRQDYKSAAVIATMPAGVLGYMLFLYLRFGDPLAFWSTQVGWNREMVGPFYILWREIQIAAQGDLWKGSIHFRPILNLMAIFTTLLMIIPIWRRLGEGYGLFALLSILIPLSSSSMSMTRFMLVIFPIFMIWGRWGRHPIVDRVMTIGFSIFLGIFLAIFVNRTFLA
jgi:Gpi18-like mannosyltransferase